MFSSSGAFGSSQGGFGGSPSGEAKRAPRQEEKQTCLPVTVRMLEAAISNRADEGGDLKVHGMEPGMLLLVGSVESLTKSATSVEFSLNDATGRMKVRHYIADVPSKDLEEIELGRHVSISGNLRTTPMVHFAAIGVQLVRSADEISYHMIESAHAALKLAKVSREPNTPSPKKVAAAEKPEAGYFGPTTAEPMDFTPPKEEAPPSAAAPPAAVPAAVAAPPMAASAPVKAAPVEGKLEGDALRQAIQAALEQGKDREEGTAVAALLERFPQQKAEEVRKILDQLVSDGEAFTTIDDDHFTLL